MKIKDLPQEIKELALLRQKEDKNPNNHDLLLIAFTWSDTPEKKSFWEQIDKGKFDVYYEKYGYPNDKPKEEVTNKMIPKLGYNLSKTSFYSDLEKELEKLNTPAHYNNEKGTLYKVADERGWNPYLFDIVKRLERAEKKGEFKTDLEKSINVIKLWLSESETK